MKNLQIILGCIIVVAIAAIIYSCLRWHTSTVHILPHVSKPSIVLDTVAETNNNIPAAENYRPVISNQLPSTQTK